MFLSENVSMEKGKKLECWEAKVVIKGRQWYEANRETLVLAD